MLTGAIDEAERELKLAQLLDPVFAANYVYMGQLLNVRGYYLNAPGAIQRPWSNAARRWRSILTTGPLTLYVSPTVTTGWEIIARH